MMIRKIYILSLLIGLTVAARGQQDAMYSEYVFNPSLINPAVVGSHDVLNASLLYRSQWVGVPGSPKTGVFSIESPVKKENVGVGVNLEFDRLGVTSHTGITGIYSYRLRFPQSSLSFGLQAGLGFSSSDFMSVNYIDNNNLSDPAFLSNFNDVIPSVGFGMYYSAERFSAGLSVPQIGSYVLQNLLYHQNEDAHLDLANHYFVSAGYMFDLAPGIKVKPSTLIKYVKGAPVEFDVNGIFYFYDMLAAGISYRSLSSVNFMAQVKASDQLYIGYAFESATTELKNYRSGSHEIMLQFFFDFSRSRIVTPRFF